MPPNASPALALLLCLLLTGCVSKSTYLQKVEESSRREEAAQALRTEAARMEEEIAGLQARNADLERQLAEALATGSALQDDLVRSRADLDRLETVLSARSQEAGLAMAEMRRTIDGLHQEIRRLQEDSRRLQEENRGLTAVVETQHIGQEARVAQVQSTYDELVRKMEAEIERGEITISDLQGKLTVNMVERILFDSGRADVKSAGLGVLQRVGDILRGVEDKEIVVEGHTDNQPIGARLRQSFPSNWELSTARAVNVVHFLRERAGIPGERLSACGYGEFRPIADNATPEGRAQNRRIQIVLMPREGRVVEPLQ